MNIKPIHTFEGLTSTGLDVVPLYSRIHIKDSDGSGTQREIILTDKTGITSATTISALLALTSQYDDTVIIPADVVSLASPGYITMPSGLIIQWGYRATDGAVTFPIAFPNAALNVQVTRTGDITPDGNNVPEYTSLTTTGVTIVCGNVGMMWTAIGY